MTQVMRSHMSTAPTMLSGSAEYDSESEKCRVVINRLKSTDVWVMLRPAEAYPWLRRNAGQGSWEATQRPLFIVFLLGCLVSLVTAGSLNLRLFAAGAVNALFVPLLEIGVLAGVWRRRQTIPFSRAVDLFFMGHGPWVLWLLLMCAIWVFASPFLAFVLTGHLMWFLVGLVAVWSAYVDFCFLRHVLGESAAQAGSSLLILRVATWGIGLVIFGGGSLWPEIVRILGL